MKIITALLIFMTFSCKNSMNNVSGPISLNPQNGHYFLYHGKPVVLISSSEHYGSIYNTTFDYMKYLNTLDSYGFNYTREFSGTMVLPPENIFNLSETPSVAEQPYYLTPWTYDGEKYNLDNWNEAYFKRLRHFVSEAEKRNIIVEYTFFSSYYAPKIWEICPLYFKNNVNQFDSIPHQQAHTLYNGKLLSYQENLIRKVIKELNEFDNVIFEIQNEPWSDNPNLQSMVNAGDNLYPAKWQKLVEVANDISIEWQNHMISLLVEEEKNLPKKHLIAQCMGNFQPKIKNPHPAVSIFTLHYAHPKAIEYNMGLNKVMALDETGFMEKNNRWYRRQAWRFMMSGGGLYNHLDYSYMPGKEDGTHQVKDFTPGWGNHELRNQIKTLKNFFEGLDFVNMKPIQCAKAENEIIMAFAKEGKEYAIYVEKPLDKIFLELPKGKYSVEVLNAIDGKTDKKNIIDINSSPFTLTLPVFEEDVIIKLLRL